METEPKETIIIPRLRDGETIVSIETHQSGTSLPEGYRYHIARLNEDGFIDHILDYTTDPDQVESLIDGWKERLTEGNVGGQI